MKKLFTLFAAMVLAIGMAWAEGRSFAAGEVLYQNASAVDWWQNGKAVLRATFDGEDKIIGVLEADGSHVAFTIPAAKTYSTVKFDRAESATADAWNATGTISLEGTTLNSVEIFAENSTEVTWGNYVPAPPVTEGREFAENEPLYFNAAGGPNWWAGVDQTMYITDALSEVTSISGVVVTGNIYKFEIPAGTYVSLYIQRGTWNKTGNIALAGTDAYDYISAFAENSSTVTWSVYEPSPVPVADVYTIAGAPTLLGSEWDVNDENNNMTDLGDGTYQLVKENVTLAAGDYEYKAVKNHAWSWSVPQSGNNTLNISESGVYNVTFILNPEATTLTANAELQHPVVVLPTIAIAGAFNGWSATNLVLTPAENELTASGKIDLTLSSETEFKVINNGNWKSNAQGFDRENNSKVITGNESNNMWITVDVAGEYTFTWTYETNTLEITFPAIPTQTLTLAATDGEFHYATFSSAKAVEFAEDVVYIVKVAGGVMSLEKASQQVPADNGVLIKSSNATVEYQEIASAAALAEANLLYPASKDKAELSGCLFYKLAYASSNLDNLGFYWGAADGAAFTSREGSAYLAVPASAAPARFLFNEVTALENKAEAVKANKTLVNGRLFILRDGKTFDVVGRIVK